MDNLLKSAYFDDLGPEKVVLVRNPSINLEGFLVIDNTSIGWPAGGIRMEPDVSLDEITRLARAMTYKFATYRLKVGGAKAGIKADPFSDDKDLLIAGFAEAIKTNIIEDRYVPGPDMNTNDRDLERIFNIIGKPGLAPKPLGIKKNNFPVEELFTGYGVSYCIEAVNNYLINKGVFKPNYKPKILLEGFGKVGIGLAMSLKELGYNLTGLSTLKGAIFDEDGLDLDELMKLRQQYGDDLINQYESKNLVRVEKEKLFELSGQYATDFLIPGARPDAINKKNVDKINIKAIIPAANIPYETGIIRVLHERKIIPFPDFVANAGEILAIGINKIAKNADEIFNFVRGQIDEKASEIIKGALENNISAYEYAVNEALSFVHKYLSRRKKHVEKISKRY